jgi:predicted acyl esterase
MTDDQRFAARRPDVLVYETEILKDNMTLAGDILAELQVSTSGTDADCCKSIDFPDEQETPEVAPI